MVILATNNNVNTKQSKKYYNRFKKLLNGIKCALLFSPLKILFCSKTDYFDFLIAVLIFNFNLFLISFFVLKYLGYQIQVSLIDFVIIIFGYSWILIFYYSLVALVLRIFIIEYSFYDFALILSHSLVYLPFFINFPFFNYLRSSFSLVLSDIFSSIYIYNNLIERFINPSKTRQLFLSLISLSIPIVPIIFYKDRIFYSFYPFDTNIRFYKNLFFDEIN